MMHELEGSGYDDCELRISNCELQIGKNRNRKFEMVRQAHHPERSRRIQNPQLKQEVR